MRSSQTNPNPARIRADQVPSLEIVAHRTSELTDYQDQAYAARYESIVETARRAEQALGGNGDKFAMAVAHNAHKVMAYKDEYAVARMFVEGEFKRSLAATFEGDYKLRFHLAPPLFAKRDPTTGEMRKSDYGPWIFGAFKVLAKMKGLRGTVWDVFGYTAERKQERDLRDNYLADIERLASSLTLDTLPTAVAIAEIPDQIRGYGHVKQRSMQQVKSLREKLFAVINKSQGMEKAA